MSDIDTLNARPHELQVAAAEARDDAERVARRHDDRAARAAQSGAGVQERTFAQRWEDAYQRWLALSNAGNHEEAEKVLNEVIG